jgi:hypothetical protein
LVLISVNCLILPRSNYTVSPPEPSPDGKNYFAYDGIQGFWLAPVIQRSPPKFSMGRVTTGGMVYGGPPPFAWAADSQSVYGVSQKTAVPSGFALSALSPKIIALDGQSRDLPMLKSNAGGLDSVRWIGNGGLALATFGTNGSYYRPEHIDRHPTIAMIDGRRGVILQAIEIGTFGGVRSDARITSVDAQTDSRGKIVTLFALNADHWFFWRQGQSPRSVALPFKRGPVPLSLTPDSKSILVMRNLSATGIICENYGQSPSRCPAATPQTGVVAELLDVVSGRRIWAINGKAENFSGSYRPAVSPDGRYALITMPADKSGKPHIALISMRDGGILQRLNSPWGSECTLGFGRDSKTAWMSGGSGIVKYRLTP